MATVCQLHRLMTSFPVACDLVTDDYDLAPNVHEFWSYHCLDTVAATKLNVDVNECRPQLPVPTSHGEASPSGLYRNSRDPMFGDQLQARWTKVHPITWSSDDVLWWSNHVISLDESAVDGRTKWLHDVSGSELVAMTASDFRQAFADFGDMLYENFREVLSKYSNTKLPGIHCFIGRRNATESPMSVDFHDTSPDLAAGVEAERGDETACDMLAETISTTPEDALFEDSSIFQTTTSLNFDPCPSTFALQLFECLLVGQPSTADSDVTDSIDDSWSSTSPLSACSYEPHVGVEAHPAANDRIMPFGLWTNSVSKQVSHKETKRPSKTKMSGTVSVSLSSTQPETVRKRRRERSKTPHLWKFMRMLLDNASCNPAYIRWENKSEGVFRIVPGQSKQVAVLWGQMKNNPSMTFDKLSRSLRWCRKYGFFRDVPKTGRYPKKLCFRFAQFALDWSPNSSISLTAAIP